MSNPFLPLKELNAKLAALQTLVGDCSIPTMPQWISFSTTTCCNLRCPHCQTHGTEEMRKLFNRQMWPREKVLGLAYECLPTAYQFCLTLSGEPLATRGVKDYFREFRRYGATLHLTTNAMLLTDDMLVSLLPLLGTVDISLDGASEVTVERLRAGVDYKKLITNVWLMSKACDLLADLIQPQIGLAFTIMASNVREMPAFVRLAHLLGIQTVAFFPLVVYYPQIESEVVDVHSEIYQESCRQTLTLGELLGVDVRQLPNPPGQGASLTASVKLPEPAFAHLQNQSSLENYLGVNIRARAAEIAAAVRRDFYSGDTQSAADLENDKFRELEESYWQALSRHRDQLLRLQGNGLKESINYCENLHCRTFIEIGGDVTPCCLPGRPVLGNINGSNVKEIWNGTLYHDFRKQFHSTRLPSCCAKCLYLRKICKGELFEKLHRDLQTLPEQKSSWGRVGRIFCSASSAPAPAKIAAPPQRDLPDAGACSPSGSDYASRLIPYFTSMINDHRTPRDLFAHVDDGFWLWANTQGYREYGELREFLPGLPDETTQANFTGLSGDATLRDGFQSYLLFKRVVEAHLGSLAQCDRILDFGCGWGRIIRFFLRDLAPEKIWGIDCMPEAIDLCTTKNRWCQFRLVPTMPPVDLEPSSFDFIYAFSVFSHLSEKAHLTWLAEFHRLLKPGGLVLLTTRERSFIEYCATLRQNTSLDAFATGAASAFPDTQHWLAAYDRGEFCHTPTGGGVNLSESFYGETCIPKAYAATRWSDRFQLLDFIDDRAICAQNVIVARKNR
ncbi:MAG: methyltransferase domain-containing protein [Pirellulales bacterium]|nr:methyltransferase domain-containing protein [Pirellulales bacterium]